MSSAQAVALADAEKRIEDLEAALESLSDPTVTTGCPYCHGGTTGHPNHRPWCKWTIARQALERS